jgi:hypothetical protein
MRAGFDDGFLAANQPGMGACICGESPGLDVANGACARETMMSPRYRRVVGTGRIESRATRDSK